MFKNNNSKLQCLWLLVLACSLVITATSCGDRFAEEIKYVEQLQQTLDSNEQTLNIDVNLLVSRAERIESTLLTFTNKYKDTMSKELGDNLSKYKNFKKIYSRKSNNYEECVKEQAALQKQLDNLLRDTKNGVFSKDEFKTYYNTEKTDLQLLVQKSQDIEKTLYEIEPEYNRLAEYFKPLLEELTNRP